MSSLILRKDKNNDAYSRTPRITCDSMYQVSTEGPGISRCRLPVNFPTLLHFLLFAVPIHLGEISLLIYSCYLDCRKKNAKNQDVLGTLDALHQAGLFTGTHSSAWGGQDCSGPFPSGLVHKSPLDALHWQTACSRWQSHEIDTINGQEW